MMLIRWCGAGVLAAGLSAAVLGGAGSAQADGSGGNHDGHHRGAGHASGAHGAKTDPTSAGIRADRSRRRASAAAATPAAAPAPVRANRTAPSAEPAAVTTTPEAAGDRHRPRAVRVTPASLGTAALPGGVPTAAVAVAATHQLRTPPVPVAGFATAATPAAISTTSAVPVLGPFQPHYPPVIRAIGSLVFNLLGALIRAFEGPPVVPASLRDEIAVSTSTLVVAPGTQLQADWYFPTSGSPDRLIYLQHGILATGPMYSYTASYLAQQTNSIVVATTITSNPFEAGNMWLGGDAMHKAIAQLLLDPNHVALNASLTTAGLQKGRTDLVVPDRFVLAGHSLGGGFAPGVAGYYAEGLVARRAQEPDAPNGLEGVITLDGVPFDPILPNALDRLGQLQSSGNASDFVPIYEIGAPWNLLNASSPVNGELTAARPGMFNGVVVKGGVHMDGMRGGNPIVQTLAYLIAGIPRKQNPQAVQDLMRGWIDDMFAGTIDPATGRCTSDCAGIYGDPGSTLTIPTASGDATAVAIGRPVETVGP